MDRAAIATVRRFNRAVAREIGALNNSYLEQGRPLGSARLLCAIGPDGREIAGLREDLDLDAGLLSRMLTGLVREGLVTLSVAPDDRRRRRATWTPSGRVEAARYDALSDACARRILVAQGRGAARLLEAMALIAAVLNRAHLTIAAVDPATPEARACVAHYYAEIATRFEGGFDPARALQPDDDAQRPPNGVFLLAAADGQPLGCVAVRRADPGVAEMKRLWVAPAGRGIGVAGRLVAAAEAEARRLGASTLRLDTNRALTEAIALYRARGFAEVPAFNHEPYAHHWFAKAL